MGALPWALLILSVLFGRVVDAATMEAVGTLGNSGVAGPGLVRVGEIPFDKSATGIAVDDDLTLWVSGGDRINRLSLDGHLIARFALQPAKSSVDSRKFAVLRDKLYFIGRDTHGRMRLFELPMRPGLGDARAHALPVELPARRREHLPYALSPQPLDGQLVIAAEPKGEKAPTTAIYFVSPGAGGRIRTAFEVHGDHPGGVAVDSERRVIYIGGRLHPSGARGGEPRFGITAVRPDGERVSDHFPVLCTKADAVPTQFRGVISVAKPAIWETAWYGFVSRLDMRGRAAPGAIVRWQHELGYPTQIVNVTAVAEADRGRDSPAPKDASEANAPQLIAMSAAMPDAVYVARWREAQQRLEFARRLGCLATISSLGISESGWVTVGTMRSQLWWRWEDGAAVPPRKAELHIAVTPGIFHAGKFFALAAQYRLDDLTKRNPVPTVFRPRVGDRNEARRIGKPVPMDEPAGLSLQLEAGEQSGTVFVTDAATGKIRRRGIHLPGWHLQGEGWEAVGLDRGDGVRAPGDIIALTDGRLLVADGGRILVLAPHNGGYRIADKFRRWGEEPYERLGNQIHLAAHGRWLLVSDTERHRILWVDWHDWRVLAQFGDTDGPGDGWSELNRPTFIALRGTRAVVADAGNQRVIKLRLSP